MHVRVTEQMLIDGLHDLGVRPGASAIVHSSMSRFGHIEGGAKTVVRALLAVLGEKGTLLLPTFPFRGLMYDYLMSDPTFDVRSTPSLMGRVTEVGRTWPGARRSLDPAHPVAAIGARAQWFVQGHERSVKSTGYQTPFGKNIEADGFVILLGVDHRNNTTLHTVEETVEPPYIYDGSRIFRCRMIDERGQTRYKEIISTTPKHPRDFARIEGPLEAEGVQRKMKIGSADVRVVRARLLYRVACELLGRDPEFLLARA